MNSQLDGLLARLRDAPPDRGLDQLEPAVWARIGRLRRQDPAPGVWGWRAALAALMLAMGVLAGGAAAAQAREDSPFAVNASLAPSTLLEGGL